MSGERILIIDDSKQIVDHLAERVLPAFGYQTMAAYNGRSGLQLIRSQQPDLIMMDFNLPDMTGIEIMQEMVKESINIPVILVTGYGSEQSAIAAFRLGARDYIIKPFTIEEIAGAVERALTESRLHLDKVQLAEEVRRLKVELSRQNQEMNTLFNIGKAITSLLSVDQVLERVLEASTHLTGAEESTIWMVGEDDEWLHPYTRHERLARRPKLSMTTSLAGEVVQNGQPLRQSNFHDEGLVIGEDFFVRAVLFVPLKLRGVTMGVLGVSNLQANQAFSQRDEFLLSFLADYAAIALENAQVFQAADQALAAGVADLNQLIGITRTLTSSLNLDEIVDLTIQLVHDGWDIEASSIWLLDKKAEMLKVLANVGTASDVLKQYEVPLGVGFVGYVTKTGKRIYTNDVASHPRHYRVLDDLTKFQTRSLLCIPLISRGEIIGAMELLNKKGGFDDADVERAMSIGSAVAIAVNNAQLYKEAEARKQHLEATLEHNTSPILITDGDNNLHLLNQVARTRLGLTNEAIGKPVLEVVEPPVLGVILTRPISELKDLPLYERIVLKDGSVWVPRVAPIPQHGRILILQDITSLQELEEAKDLFIATVSHDMRAPLNAIAGFAQNLSYMGPLNEEQEVFVNHILSSTDRMMNMVTGLLELAKVNTRWQQQKHPCDIGQIIRDVVNDFEGIALANHIKLVLQTEESLPAVEGDATQLRSAVSNLVDNAIKYSTADHTITITAKNQPETLLLSVQDEGIGIPAEQQPHIFEMFYRAAPAAASGVGLGLALVKSIVKSHQGQIWVESEEGQGSTFYLQLPTISV
ncbi:MAG: GAF domain-containing protein [Ardenticatenaceae bacterium]|nr:GAF domain-containing protein [Ardenticatenaceae bacterium]